MTEFVRVKLENGSTATLNKAVAKTEGLEVLEENPLDHRGRPRPVELPADEPETEPEGGDTPPQAEHHSNRSHHGRASGDKPIDQDTPSS